MRRLTLRVFRYKSGEVPHYDTFAVEVPDTANVIDALERAWDQHDRTLAFRHACHHASCGSCGLRINQREQLPCVTPVAAYPEGATLTVEPLRNFDVTSDLAVDLGPLYARMLAVRAPGTRPAEPLQPGSEQPLPEGVPELRRFVNCIECGLCISACPAAAADRLYLGPAAIAGAERAWQQAPDQRPALLHLLDDEHALWRCHSAWECTDVCPMAVLPAESIMRLRRAAAAARLRRLLGGAP